MQINAAGQVVLRLKTRRHDGWTLLSTAGNIIKRDAPDELQELRKRFGHSTLKGVLLAAALFDVEEEPTSAGETRTIYRINANWKLRCESRG